MAGEVIVDALPYIDEGYDEPGVRESALALVEEECRRFRPTKNYLEHLPSLNNMFETKLMANEFERIQNRQPMETLSMKRYELPPPPAGKLSELSAWQESVENSMAQLEHQWVREMNLELMLDYGIEAWKAYLDVFVAMQAKAQTQLQQLKKDIQDVNWRRKKAQTEAGEKLKGLEANWVLLVSKNYELEQEIAKIEKRAYNARLKLQELTERQSEMQQANHDNNMEKPEEATDYQEEADPDNYNADNHNSDNSNPDNYNADNHNSNPDNYNADYPDNNTYDGNDERTRRRSADDDDDDDGDDDDDDEGGEE